jgi:hypothetical protein
MKPVGRHIAGFMTTNDIGGMQAESKTRNQLQLQNYSPDFDEIWYGGPSLQVVGQVYFDLYRSKIILPYIRLCLKYGSSFKTLLHKITNQK